MKMPEKSQTMPSIAKTLKKEHYQTHYLYGGDINFTNMRGYLIATGWDKLTSVDDYPPSQVTSKWGVDDDITFDTFYQMTVSAKQPFLYGFSTLSSHEPWEVPIHKFDDKVLNSFYYLDQCIGQFIDKLKKTEAWKNLLIVMLPDHGILYKDLDETMPLKNQIPVVWTGGAIKGPRRINKICNQSDLAATLLGQLGLNHDDFTFSRDVLSTTYRYPTAVHNYNNAQSMIDSTGFILYDFDASRFIKRDSKDAERMLDISKAILQATTNDLKNR
jgi:phosphoglycerol transferase MdoB-like AlkP superfamily enzyme